MVILQVPVDISNHTPRPIFHQAINVIIWSPCGRFLAAATVGGYLCVWDVETKLCLERYGIRLVQQASFRAATIYLNPFEKDMAILKHDRSEIFALAFTRF